MLGIRLDKDTEERLEILCKKTGRTKTYYAKKAIKEFINDKEDYLLALADLEENKVSVKFISKDQFNTSLKRIQKIHAKTIQDLADR